MSEREPRVPEETPPTPLWKRIVALLAAIFVLFLTFAFTWALATGRMFWI